MRPPFPSNESERLTRLRQYYLLDTPPEPAFDRLTALTARLFNAPISLVTLIDASRQWIKSAYGLELRETQRDASFCAHATLGDGVLVSPDAREDPCFRDNPLVAGPPYIRFYAGAPVKTADGYNLGTLCILDTRPRDPLTPEQERMLSELAATVMDEIERRLVTLAAARQLEGETGVERGVAAIAERLELNRETLARVLDALPVGVWLANDRGDIVLSNRAAREIWGGARYVGPDEVGVYRGWWAETGDPVPPEDWAVLRAIRTGQPALGEIIDIETFDAARKTIVNSAAPICDASGAVAGAVAVNDDITAQARAERELQRRERQFKILSDATRQVNSVLAPAMVLRNLVTSAIALVEAGGGSAGLMKDGRMVFDEYVRPTGVQPISRSFEAGIGAPGQVMATRRAYISNNAASDPHVVPAIREALGFDNLIALPVIDRQGRLLGCFEIHNKNHGAPFDQSDLEVLEILASAAAVALENARTLEDLSDARDSLRRSEEQLRAVIESSPAGIAGESLDGQLLSVNLALCCILGYGPDELIGRNGIEFVHPDDRELAARRFHDLVSGASPGYETERRYVRKDGEIADVIVRASLVRSAAQDPLFATAVFEDVTERRRTERALQESEERYRRLVESSPNAIAVHIDRKVVFVNPAALKLFGAKDAGELLGRPISDFVHPDYRETTEERMRGLAEGRDAPLAEVVLLRLDGQPIHAELASTAFELHGTPSIQSVIRDITQQVQLEAEYRHAQKMEAVGRLAGGVAHDFNNLLTVINGYAELLLHRAPASDPMRPALSEIYEAGQHAAALTSQLLASSRRQSGRPTVANLNTLVTKIESLIRRLVGADVQLITELDPSAGSVKIDPGQFEQVLMNLAVNARDAMPQGGALTLATSNVVAGPGHGDHPRVAPGEYVVLSVSDTGVGMDDETQMHMFEPFFTTKETGKGTGLGLSTVYGIVTQAKGSIRVTSAPGRGAAFAIYLPRVEPRREGE